MPSPPCGPLDCRSQLTEISRIQSLVKSTESNLLAVNEDIDHIQSILNDLLHKREAIQHDLDSDKSLLAPIRRLPYELLCEIFQARCTDNFTSVKLHTDTLWTIIQVCPLWRETALSTPKLWSTILIDLSHLQGKPINYTRLLSRLEACLTRSQNLPLSFALTGTHYQDSAHIVPLITTLCTHSHRWHKVYFCPYTTNILASWLPPAFRHMPTPHLTALGLTSFNPSPGLLQTPTRFTCTPSLSRLALYDYRPRSNPDPTHLPTFSPQITSLYLDSCPYYAYIDILPYLPNLTHLEILNKYQHSARVPGNSIHLPNLLTFKATGWLGNLCFLLPHLRVPGVRRIDIVALEEQCHPCTCAVVKRQIINDWVETLGSGVRVAVRHTPNLDLKMSTDDGVVRFLFSDSD